MQQLQPVIWSKGTYLTQQHLQVQDLFLESSLHFRLNALHFRPWGFQSVVIDQEALAGGFFSLTRAAGIFPDGLLFDMPGSDHLPAPKALAACFDPDEDELDVYMAIPPYRQGGLNVATLQSGADTRYNPEVMLLKDENTGLTEKPVQIARKNFRFQVKSELHEGSISVRVARIKRSQAGLFTASPSFVPPLIDFQASAFLASMARRITEILFARSTQLSGMRRQRNQTLADFSASDVANFWLLYTINSYSPAIHHLLEIGTCHPERLFQAMLSLAGALTTFSTTLHPRDLPRYDHDDLAPPFLDLERKLLTLLDTAVPTNCITLPLRKLQPSIYGTPIENDKYLKDTILYLAVNAEAPQAEIIAKTPHLVKVCSAHHIEHLVRQALPGVPLTHVPVPPNSLPLKLNYQYFSITQSGLAWEAVGRARTFAAYVPGELPNPQMELVILLPSVSASAG
jgi:type VI secretion system protein ImpJ